MKSQPNRDALSQKSLFSFSLPAPFIPLPPANLAEFTHLLPGVLSGSCLLLPPFFLGGSTGAQWAGSRQTGCPGEGSLHPTKELRLRGSWHIPASGWTHNWLQWSPTSATPQTDAKTWPGNWDKALRVQAGQHGEWTMGSKLSCQPRASVHLCHLLPFFLALSIYPAPGF